MKAGNLEVDISAHAKQVVTTDANAIISKARGDFSCAISFAIGQGTNDDNN